MKTMLEMFTAHPFWTIVLVMIALPFVTRIITYPFKIIYALLKHSKKNKK